MLDGMDSRSSLTFNGQAGSYTIYGNMQTFTIGDRKPIVPTPVINRSIPPSTRFDRSIDALPSPSGGGGGATLQFPFQLQDHSTTGGTPVAIVNVRYGTMMDVEPTNCETDITLVDGTNTIYIHITIDINGEFLTAEILTGTSGQPANGDYDGYITLGTFVVASGLVTSVNQAATHSLRMQMCGRIVTDGTLTTPGDYEFWGF